VGPFHLEVEAKSRSNGQGGSGRTLWQQRLSATDKHGLPHEAGNRSQNERNEGVDRGKDKGAPILHSSRRKTGFRKELKGGRKATASRYYQLLTGRLDRTLLQREAEEDRLGPMLVV